MTKEDFLNAFPAFRGKLQNLAPAMIEAGRQQSIPRNAQIYSEVISVRQLPLSCRARSGSIRSGNRQGEARWDIILSDASVAFDV